MFFKKPELLFSTNRDGYFPLSSNNFLQIIAGIKETFLSLSPGSLNNHV
jgi:hypothetical protein